MTFQEWAIRWDVLVHSHKSGAAYVFTRDVPDSARWGLFHLVDWCVTGAMSGPTWWLSPRVALVAVS